MILDKLLEKKDLIVYIKVRRKALKGSMSKEIAKAPVEQKENVRRLFMGRIRELNYLENLVQQDRIKAKGKEFWREVEL